MPNAAALAAWHVLVTALQLQLRAVEEPSAFTVGITDATAPDEAEPLADGKESPWDDLWFYSNPVFVRVR
ncbi:hypothetical protein [Micromonospora sp. NPDC050200]|uniref:hypothetical protein n=1 Tax=Micromonospora sp. NPDC050200 TaxID=3155664 RepID=UPI0033EFA0FF